MTSKPVTTLDEKIRGAMDRGELYTPTMHEYDIANQSQKNRMTWPQYILDQIARERP